MTLLMTASCESGNKEFGYDGETAVYFANAGYVRTVELGEDQEVDLTDDNNHIINIKAYCAGGYGNNNDVTVDYISDASLCDGYKINGDYIYKYYLFLLRAENRNAAHVADDKLIAPSVALEVVHLALPHVGKIAERKHRAAQGYVQGCRQAHRGRIDGIGEADVVVAMTERKEFVIRLPVSGREHQSCERHVCSEAGAPFSALHTEGVFGEG